ncbi:unnamed protein product [Calypogeia fissa]
MTTMKERAEEPGRNVIIEEHRRGGGELWRFVKRKFIVGRMRSTLHSTHKKSGAARHEEAGFAEGWIERRRYNFRGSREGSRTGFKGL